MNKGLKQKILDKAKSHIQLCVNEVLTGEEFVNKKDVLGLLDEVAKQIQEFSNWLEARARLDEEDFRKKRWNVKAEARVIKEKFDEVLDGEHKK